MARLVKPNDILYVDDGKIILIVVDCDRVSYKNLIRVYRTLSVAKSSRADFYIQIAKSNCLPESRITCRL